MPWSKNFSTKFLTLKPLSTNDKEPHEGVICIGQAECTDNPDHGYHPYILYGFLLRPAKDMAQFMEAVWEMSEKWKVATKD